jgi:hypothetical protein
VGALGPHHPALIHAVDRVGRTDGVITSVNGLAAWQ